MRRKKSDRRQLPPSSSSNGNDISGEVSTEANPMTTVASQLQETHLNPDTASGGPMADSKVSNTATNNVVNQRKKRARRKRTRSGKLVSKEKSKRAEKSSLTSPPPQKRRPLANNARAQENVQAQDDSDGGIDPDGVTAGTARAIDFNALTLASLRKYRRVHRLRLKPTSSKLELVRAVTEHFHQRREDPPSSSPPIAEALSQVRRSGPQLTDSTMPSLNLIGLKIPSRNVVYDVNALDEQQIIDSFVASVRSGESVLHPPRRRRTSVTSKSPTLDGNDPHHDHVSEEGEELKREEDHGPAQMMTLQRKKQLLVQKVKSMIGDLDLSQLAQKPTTALTTDANGPKLTTEADMEKGPAEYPPLISKVNVTTITESVPGAQPNL
jgi:hypothetical protein